MGLFTDRATNALNGNKILQDAYSLIDVHGAVSASVEHFPEHPTAYLFDVIKDTLSRTKDFYLLVQRTGWYFPLHLDSGNQTYINMMYQQIRPDLLDGTMLVVPNKTLSKALKVGLFPTDLLFIQCVSKNASILASCNFNKHGLILIIFGKQQQHIFKNDTHIHFPCLFIFTYFICF